MKFPSGIICQRRFFNGHDLIFSFVTANIKAMPFIILRKESQASLSPLFSYLISAYGFRSEPTVKFILLSLEYSSKWAPRSLSPLPLH